MIMNGVRMFSTKRTGDWLAYPSGSSQGTVPMRPWPHWINGALPPPDCLYRMLCMLSRFVSGAPVTTAANMSVCVTRNEDS